MLQVDVFPLRPKAVNFFNWKIVVLSVLRGPQGCLLILERILGLSRFGSIEEAALAGLGEVVSHLVYPLVFRGSESEGLVSQDLVMGIDLFIAKLLIEVSDLIVLGKNALHLLVEDGCRPRELHRVGKGLALGLLQTLHRRPLLDQITEDPLHL